MNATTNTDESEAPDAAMGAWVYCKSHVGPHLTGWCAVGVDRKVALDLPETATRQQANEVVWAMGLSIYGYCDVCHKWVANEPWLHLGGRTNCPEHDA
jgi:hypothetical protein